MAGGKFDAKAAVGIIYDNYDFLAEACVESNGQIAYTGSNENLIAGLRKQKLISELDDDFGVRLNLKVRDFIMFLEGHQRFREQHGAIAGMIEEMEEYVSRYHELMRGKAKGNLQDTLLAIREIASDLVDTLTLVIYTYRYFVSGPMSYSKDIDQRIYEINRCTTELGKINEIFKSLSAEHLNELTGSSSDLKKILVKGLGQSIVAGLDDLQYINVLFEQRLDKLLSDSKLIERRNRIIDSFAERYHDNPRYTPQLVAVKIPAKLCCAQHFATLGYPDMQTADPNRQSALLKFVADTIRRYKNKDESRTQESEPSDVEDQRGETYEVELDPVETAIDYMFQLVLSDEYQEDVSALECYQKIKPECSYENWLLLVISKWNNVLAKRSNVVCREVEVTNDPYNGTILVSDVIFSKLKG